jgi:hypothetical protein
MNKFGLKENRKKDEQFTEEIGKFFYKILNTKDKEDHELISQEIDKLINQPKARLIKNFILFTIPFFASVILVKIIFWLKPNNEGAVRPTLLVFLILTLFLIGFLSYVRRPELYKLAKKDAI